MNDDTKQKPVNNDIDLKITNDDTNITNNDLLSYTMKYAIKENNLHLAKYIHKKGYILTSHIFLKAIDVGNLEVIKWLCDNNCPYNMSDALAIAAKNGHLHMLEFMYTIIRKGQAAHCI